MLDTDTKRRIDTARDILVGKVPDPKSQVEQITIALIYKFMDDMDAESEELGGKRKFFAKEFARYGWAKLMRSGLGGFETLNLYAEAIAKMPENPGIPPLFRDIFKNAYLPYRDPETLKMFLKVIDEFNYDHSERLGDAFEYLLSVLGSQGDAGQFRTPRHVIDFMVEVVDPKKNETVLDPACGTAGFLISAYKHILRVNSSQSPLSTPSTSSTSSTTTLTPDERGRLAQNFRGYDISPDMVRLSLVNLYLHGFVDPHIAEYDTLTSLDKWNEHADVILANPPFMSPKGGIKPHNRFSVQSKRSEVLFVDYMAEHLTPNGRAGIIVPEGIIFQSQTAYKQLRKMLMDEYLVAVISLPAGVFNPYSGVKTSILILDKALAKRSSDIAFVKVENDGYGLGAQRREIEKNDLPAAADFLKAWFQSSLSTSFTPSTPLTPNALIIAKAKIAANGDYNLSGERYREGIASTSAFPLVALGEICELVRGVVFAKGDEVSESGAKVLRANNIDKDRYELNLDDIKQVSPRVNFPDEKRLKRDDIFICLASGSKDHIGKVALVKEDTDFYFGGFMGAIRVKPERLHAGYLLKQMTTGHFNDFLREQIAGASINNLSAGLLYRFQIPLPPLDVQKEIVAEIEGYQKIIDGARAVLDNYRPHIPINPDWPETTIGECCEVKGGKRLPMGEPFSNIPTKHPYIRVTDFHDQSIDLNDLKFISDEIHQQIARYTISSADVYISIAGTIGLMGTVPEELDGANLTENAAKLVFDEDVIDKQFLSIVGNGELVQSQIRSLTHAVGVPKLALERIKMLKFPLPPLATQQAIVAEIEAEQKLVAANRELIARMEKKIQGVLARVWGEDKPAPEER